MNFLKIFFISLGIFFSQPYAQAQQCKTHHDKAQKSCSVKEFQKYEARLASITSQLEGTGLGNQASTLSKNVAKEQIELSEKIEACKQVRNNCINTCRAEAAAKAAVQPPAPIDHVGIQLDNNHEQACYIKLEQQEVAARATSKGFGETLGKLAELMMALGMQKQDDDDPTKVAELPLCSRDPGNPVCRTDTASTDSGSKFSTGDFRQADAGAFDTGELGGEAPIALGAAAAQPSASSPLMGAGLPSLGGGGGGMGNSKPTSAEKKSEFDGTPKINLASGFANSGGGGGGPGGGRGGGGVKSSANPLASRTALDSDQQAGKIAQAAEERLRGPANAEPLGGISSVYYLDNFTKVEKRMITERNTLQEH